MSARSGCGGSVGGESIGGAMMASVTRLGNVMLRIAPSPSGRETGPDVRG
jgi:hypothetical protein